MNPLEKVMVNRSQHFKVAVAVGLGYHNRHHAA